MSEFQRLYGKKTLVFLLILMLLNAALFIFSGSPDSEITPVGESYREYADSYDDYVYSVYDNSDRLTSIGIFRNPFVYGSIAGTADSWYELSSIQINEADNRGIVWFITYRLTDCFILLFLAMQTVSMLSERKKGLAYMIRSTAHGRARLYVTRVLILLFSSVAAAVLFYGGNLLVMTARFGSADMSAEIQSLPEFIMCPYRMSVGTFIVVMTAAKAAAAFTVALAFFVLISIAGTGMACAVTALAAAGEYMLYTGTPAVSSKAYLRYINIFSALKPDCFFTEGGIVNISGQAVPVYETTAVMLAVCSLVFFAAGLFIHGRRYVKETDIFGMIYDRLSVYFEKAALQRTMAGWEMYKLLIRQRGIIFIAGALILSAAAAEGSGYVYKTDYREFAYYDKYSGPVTEESYQAAVHELETLNKQTELNTKRYTDAMKKMYSASNEFIIMTAYGHAENFRKEATALSAVTGDMEKLLGYSRRTGKTADLIRPYSYELLLSRDKGSRDSASLFILIGIIGTVSGIFAFDRQSNMKSTVRSSFRGRTPNRLARIIPVCIICAAVCVAVHLVQFVQINSQFGFVNTDSPVQSIPFLSEFAADLTIRQYLILLFAARAAAAAAVCLVCCAVSRYSPDTTTAMGISLFILITPSVAAVFIPQLNIINAVYLLGGGGL